MGRFTPRLRASPLGRRGEPVFYYRLSANMDPLKILFTIPRLYYLPNKILNPFGSFLLYACQWAFGGINSRIRALARCCDLFHDPLDSHILPASIGRADNGGACQSGIHTAIGLPVYAGRPPELILLKSEGYARGSAPSIPGLLQKSQPCRLRILVIVMQQLMYKNSLFVLLEFSKSYCQKK
jgi:hypothetical protein